MTTHHPDPDHLRESAAALIQLAQDMEEGRRSALPLPPSHEYLLPYTLLQNIAREMLEENRERRIFVELGAFSHEALAILLATFAAGSGDAICIDDVDTITGLPPTTGSRLLCHLSRLGAVELQTSTGDPAGHRLALSEDMRIKLSGFLMERVSARLTPSR